MALGDRYLDHLRDRVFPGGCFFATAVLEMGTGPGPVRERVAAFQRELFGLIAGLVAAAQQEGGLVGEEPRALAFEINAQFLAASAAFVLADDPASWSWHAASCTDASAVAVSRRGSARPRHAARAAGLSRRGGAPGARRW